MRYVTRQPIGGGGGLEVHDTKSDHPNRNTICYTNGELAKRVAAGLNIADPLIGAQDHMPRQAGNKFSVDVQFDTMENATAFRQALADFRKFSNT